MNSKTRKGETKVEFSHAALTDFLSCARGKIEKVESRRLLGGSTKLTTSPKYKYYSLLRQCAFFVNYATPNVTKYQVR